MALKTQDYIDMEDRHGAHNYHPLDVVITKAEGVWVYDVEGKKYMDCLAAYSAVNQGHCHPRILEALKEQASRVTLTSRAFRNDQLGPLCRQICEITGMQKVLPMNSGAEAVETAVKAARKWGYKVKGVQDGKAEILVCTGNFHGRTTTIVSFSTDKQYQDGFGPFTPGFRVVEYGDADALEQAFTPNTVALLIEPIQGEAGIIIPPKGYLTHARELCDKHNALLIADEIQSGLGRTGLMFAHEHEDNAQPDMLILGKALSGGYYPVSVVAGSEEVLGVFKPGDHGSTFGGNPLACAIAREALNILIDEGLVEKSAELGTYMLERLQAIHSPHIKEIRGRGLWIGVQLTQEAGGARRFCEALQKEGMLCKETHEDVIRIAPPLVITREELDWALERVEKVLTTL